MQIKSKLWRSSQKKTMNLESYIITTGMQNIQVVYLFLLCDGRKPDKACEVTFSYDVCISYWSKSK